MTYPYLISTDQSAWLIVETGLQEALFLEILFTQIVNTVSTWGSSRIYSVSIALLTSAHDSLSSPVWCIYQISPLLPYDTFKGFLNAVIYHLLLGKLFLIFPLTHCYLLKPFFLLGGILPVYICSDSTMFYYGGSVYHLASPFMTLQDRSSLVTLLTESTINAWNIFRFFLAARDASLQSQRRQRQSNYIRFFYNSPPIVQPLAYYLFSPDSKHLYKQFPLFLGSFC